jgi:hypothetical protein
MINRNLFVSSGLLTCLLAVTPAAQAADSSTHTSWNASFDQDSFALLDGLVAGQIIDPSADFSSITPGASAPEPATLSLMGLGIAGIAIGLARRKRK